MRSIGAKAAVGAQAAAVEYLVVVHRVRRHHPHLTQPEDNGRARIIHGYKETRIL